MRRTAVALSAPIALWMALAVASCVYAPRQSLRPQDAPFLASPLSIDGTYCFTTAALTLREYSLVHVVTEGSVYRCNIRRATA